MISTQYVNCSTYLQPVAVDSILVRDLDFEELCEPETANGPYPTERLAEVDEADTALSSFVVSPENFHGTAVSEWAFSLRVDVITYTQLDVGSHDESGWV